MRTVAVALLCAVLVGACGRGGERAPTTAPLENPGACEPVDVAAAPDVTRLLEARAESFNGSAEARPAPNQCVFVRIHAVEPPQAVNYLVDGWSAAPPEAGPPPALWVPASSAWITLTAERRDAAGKPAIVDRGPVFGTTYPVIAMPQPMAEALGWPEQTITWAQLADLATDERGRAAHGHPEWADFRLGKADPNLSTPALLQTLATSQLPAERANALEASVVYYGDTTWPFFDTLYRLDEKRTAPFVSAVAADERAVAAYNAGSTNGLVPAPDADATPPHVPLVAIPAPTSVDSGNRYESDYRLAPVTGSWVTAAARVGAEAFSRFVFTPAGRKATTAAGLTVPPNQPQGTGPAVTPALEQWTKIRKQSRVMLLFDVSDSMGDPSDPKDDASPTKIALAKRSLLESLSRFSADDQVGLRIFTTELEGGPSDRWQDVVPIGKFADNKSALTRAINGLTPQQGSPLYAATRDAYDTMNASYDDRRINGVVMITDGHNEDDEHDDRAALLDHLREPVRMFTISYSPDADLATLRKIAQATNARVYDATDPKLLANLYPAAVSNF